MVFTPETDKANAELTADQLASFPATASGENPLLASDDERLRLLTADDPAAPESAVRGLINWNYEALGAAGTWEIQAAKSLMLTFGCNFRPGNDTREGDIFGVYINPTNPKTRIVLSTDGAGIDGQLTRRYTKGTSLVFRYTLFPASTDASGNPVPPRYGLQVLQQTSSGALQNRGSWAVDTYYLVGDVVSFNGALYLRQIEGSDSGAFDPTKWVGGAPSGGAALQPAVAAFVKNAGGGVGLVALAALDEFEARGRAAGWWATGVQCWVPVGTFAASQVPLISPAAVKWTFTGFEASDYSQETGYVVRANTSKSIATSFVPSANGLSSRNLTLAVATTVDVKPQSIFGRLVGTASGDGEALYVSNVENSFGVRGNVLNHSFGLEGTVAVGTYDASYARCFLNGTFQLEKPSTSTPLDDEILLFRSQRGNGLNYAEGSIGFYWLGTAMSKEQALDFSAAITALMARLRSIYQKEAVEFFGDSITARSGASQGGAARSYAHLTAMALGYRDKNNAQGGSELTRNTADGAVSGINRYQPLTNTASAGVVMVYGTNDMASDSNTDGDANRLQDFLIGLSIVTSTLQEAGKRVVLGTPPYRADTGTHSLVKQQKYAYQVADRAVQFKTGFADLLRAFLDTGNANAYLADGVHPNDNGHELMAEYMLYAWRGVLVRKPRYDFTTADFTQPTATITLDVLGARVGMSVQIMPISQVDAALVVQGYVSAPHLVQLSFSLSDKRNLSSAAPAAVQLLVKVS